MEDILNMSKREKSKPYSVEVQKGPISMDEQYSLNFRREPEHTIRDLEQNRMRQEKMTLTLHTPKQ
jgi:hypothetical protein